MSTHWYWEQDGDGIVWLHADDPDHAANLLSTRSLNELSAALQAIDTARPLGLVIVSDKRNGFIAGADVAELAQVDSIEAAERHIHRVHGIFGHLEALPFPSLALIHGFCLGGGAELALACRYRVARDDPATRIGFPEVRLGIFPGYGGTARACRLLGPRRALQLMLTGRTLDARAAQRIGLVDLAVPERQLRAAARELILTLPSPRRPAWRERVLGSAPARPALAWAMRRAVRRRAPPEHYPAPYALLDHWQRHGGSERSLYAGEAHRVPELLLGATARNLMRLFFLQERLKDLGRDSGFSPRHVHVVGGGAMGGDIAAWCALKGLRVTLQDRAPACLTTAVQRASTLFVRQLKDRYRVQAALDRFMPDPRGYGVAKADVVIEAIYEDVEAKRALFSSLEAHATPDALLATNTSSIPLELIGTAMHEPARLVGLHFFNPVAKMQLVELVRGEQSDARSVSRAAAFVRSIDRLPLPVNSRPGFLVNRVLMPYLLEAVDLIEEGVPAPVVDQAANAFGMPIGPVELADAVGLDICLSVAEKLAEHVGEAVPERLRRLVADKCLGRKTGRGFYRYHENRVIKDRVPRHYRAPEDLQERLIFRLLNGAVACLREGVTADEDLLDAGMVLGAGFAPFRGGPMRYIEQGGLVRMRRRLDTLHRDHGEHFSPDAGWVHLGRA